jgi:DeoR family fructose operon transcriptional repressor
MLPEQRRLVILRRLDRAGSLPIAELARQLGVSKATIRRDLGELASQHLARCARGRAVLVAVPGSKAKPCDDDKQDRNRPQKRAIAREALRLIEDGDVVALGPGTPTRHVAAALRPESNGRLSFVTTSIGIALTLQENGWEEIVLPGGELHAPTGTVVGPHADRTLRMLNADVLFLSARGVHPDAGLTTPDPAEAETTRRLVEMARKVVVLADHTKLGVVALADIAPLSHVDDLIVDDKAPEETLREMALAGVHVIVFPTEAHAPLFDDPELKKPSSL